MKALESSSQDVRQRSIMQFEKRLVNIESSVSRLSKVVGSSREEVLWLTSMACDKQDQEISTSRDDSRSSLLLVLLFLLHLLLLLLLLLSTGPV
ncbi:unnamed protein product [Prorocentrum cordatum]|uniref:Uncharacterized protein n=1 Tax=Prorocentrum cordatum TaxID=2364126 RepID=A0ABN9TFK6_9DINO|nr:unnamed protein product [Polarella glacialis]